MLPDEIIEDDAHEYLQLRREEELLKFQECVVERKANIARAAAAKARHDATVAREIAACTEEIQRMNHRRRCPPPPTLAPDDIAPDTAPLSPAAYPARDSASAASPTLLADYEDSQAPDNTQQFFPMPSNTSR
jgi:hypothetical protein